MADTSDPSTNEARSAEGDRTPVRRSGVSTRTLFLAMAIVVVIVAGVSAIVFWLWPQSDEGAVVLLDHPAETTETVSFAGAFPAAEAEPLANPMAIAASDGLFFVAEADAARVRVFSPNGGDRGTIGLPTGETGRVAYPVDIAVIDGDRLAVVDTANAVVLIVSAEADGDTQAVVVGQDDAATMPGAPTAVTASEGTILVADASRNALMRYDADGRFIAELPLDLDPDPGPAGGLTWWDDRLLMSDSNNGRVAVLAADTAEQLFFLDKRMALPRGSVTDGRRLFVADRFGRIIEVFSADGIPLGSFGDGTRTGASLAMPNDVAWYDPTQRLYVADAAEGRIAVFNVR